MSKKSFKKDLFSISNEDESLLVPSKEIKKEAEPVVTAPIPLFSIHVVHPNLRKRSGPSRDFGVTGFITDMGIYDIFEQRDGWGKLADDCWINLDYTSEIKK